MQAGCYRNHSLIDFVIDSFLIDIETIAPATGVMWDERQGLSPSRVADARGTAVDLSAMGSTSASGCSILEPRLRIRPGRVKPSLLLLHPLGS